MHNLGSYSISSQATVVPPAIQQAYVYLNAGASARATFTALGIAKAEWTSLPYELISFGFPVRVFQLDFDMSLTTLITSGSLLSWSPDARTVSARLRWVIGRDLCETCSCIRRRLVKLTLLQMTGKLSTTVGYTFPSINYALGCKNSIIVLDRLRLTKSRSNYRRPHVGSQGSTHWQQQWV
jgi:hypothetical protein